ncbi:MAG: hypothetical protein R3F11_19445 [Verrucomicrobiales bacterium]
MARGVIHLILYRAVYMYLVPVPEDITGLSGVLAFMLAAYLLYLRVSGLFHFIVGSLCLFGFNLPETHRLYLLAKRVQRLLAADQHLLERLHDEADLITRASCGCGSSG